MLLGRTAIAAGPRPARPLGAGPEGRCLRRGRPPPSGRRRHRDYDEDPEEFGPPAAIRLQLEPALRSPRIVQLPLIDDIIIIETIRTTTTTILGRVDGC